MLRVLGEQAETITISQRVQLARALGRFYKKLRAIESTRAGSLVAPQEMANTGRLDLVGIRPFGSDPVDVLPSRVPAVEPKGLTMPQMLANALGRRLHSEQSFEEVGRVEDMTEP